MGCAYVVSGYPEVQELSVKRSEDAVLGIFDNYEAAHELFMAMLHFVYNQLCDKYPDFMDGIRFEKLLKDASIENDDGDRLLWTSSDVGDSTNEALRQAKGSLHMDRVELPSADFLVKIETDGEVAAIDDLIILARLKFTIVPLQSSYDANAYHMI